MTTTQIKIEHLVEDLILSFTGKREASSQRIHNVVNELARNQHTDTDGFQVRKELHGLVEKIRIAGGDNAAAYTSEKLQQRYERLLNLPDIPSYSNIPDLDENGERILYRRHLINDTLSLLMTLSKDATAHASTYCDQCIAEEKTISLANQLTWREIFPAEEEMGEHWKTPYNDYLLEERDMQEELKLLEVAEWDVEGIARRRKEEDDRAVEEQRQQESERSAAASSAAWRQKQIVQEATGDDARTQEVFKQQYWKESYKSLPSNAHFSANEAITLEPAMTRLHIEHDDTLLSVDRNLYITELKVMREVLFMLIVTANRRGTTPLFQLADDTINVTAHTYALRHLTSGSFKQILAKCAALGTIMARIRKFAVKLQDGNFGPTCTAFGQALASALLQTDRILSREETDLVQSDTVSMLELIGKIKGYLEPHSSLYDAVLSKCLLRRDSHRINAYALLSLLYSEVQAAQKRQSLDAASAEYFAYVGQLFLKSLMPMWEQMDEWTRWGSISSSTEFFVVENGITERMRTTSREWKEADWNQVFQLRKEEDGISMPSFLEHDDFANKVLVCGKTINILYGLGAPMNDDPVMGMHPLRHLEQVICGETPLVPNGHKQTKGEAAIISNYFPLVSQETKSDETELPITEPVEVDFAERPFESSLSLCLQHTFRPRYLLQSKHFKEILLAECGLSKHLHAITGLYLMQEGYDMDVFCANIFEKMDRGLRWYDQHVVSATFVTALNEAGWLDMANATARVTNLKSLRLHMRSLKPLSNIVIEYRVSWPLNIIFSSNAFEDLRHITTFIMQIKRAKHKMERISLIKSADAMQKQLVRWTQTSPELILFYSIRMRLMWFVNVIWNYIMTTVLHYGCQTMEKEILDAVDIDEMMKSFTGNISTMRDRALLSAATIPIHTAILSILDMTLGFSDAFNAYTGEQSFNMSMSAGGFDSFNRRRRRRLRHRRQPRKQIVRHADGRIDIADTGANDEDEYSDSEDDSGDEDFFDATEASANASAFVSFVEESFLKRLERMQRDFESRLAFTRETIDGLARTGGFWWFEILASDLVA